MIRFLREDRLGTEFKRITADGGEVALAAPFWGRGAARLLGLKPTSPIKVLCRFNSPACNPEALLELSNLGATIRSHGRLHAKVYLTRKAVIVGSSNPSRYGLTQEGDVEAGTVEGNILTDEPAVLRTTWQLFAELWDDHAETFRVSRTMIKQEIRRRALEPPPVSPRILRARSLLAACREAPDLFESVVVGAYQNDLDPGGREALRSLRTRAASPEPELGTADFRNAWGYQFEERPPAGAWIVDLDCRGPRPRIRGASQVPSPALSLKVKGENDVTPTIRGIVSVAGARGKFRLTQQDRDHLASVAHPLLRGKSFPPLPSVIRMIDQAQRLPKSPKAHAGATVEARRAFAQAYAKVAAETARTMTLMPTSGGAYANTSSFQKLNLKDLPGAWPRHEFGLGSPSKYVNVLLPHAAEARDAVRASGILEGTDYTAEIAQKSLAIRARTPAVDPRRPFQEQREAVEQGLVTLDRLVARVTRNEAKLAALL